jgi:hypothetical protein
MACANSGKHLVTNAEWQAAAAGTPTAGGDPPGCNFAIDNTAPTLTGAGTNCVSVAGMENMVGSLWEMVSDLAVVSASPVIPLRGGGYETTDSGPLLFEADAALTSSDPAIGFRCGMRLR